LKLKLQTNEQRHTILQQFHTVKYL